LWPELSAYATTYRYPTPGRIIPGPSKDDLDGIIERIAKALSEASRRFGVDLSASGTPASNPGPIR